MTELDKEEILAFCSDLEKELQENRAPENHQEQVAIAPIATLLSDLREHLNSRPLQESDLTASTLSQNEIYALDTLSNVDLNRLKSRSPRSICSPSEISPCSDICEVFQVNTETLPSILQPLKTKIRECVTRLKVLKKNLEAQPAKPLWIEVIKSLIKAGNLFFELVDKRQINILAHQEKFEERVDITMKVIDSVLENLSKLAEFLVEIEDWLKLGSDIVAPPTSPVTAVILFVTKIVKLLLQLGSMLFKRIRPKLASDVKRSPMVSLVGLTILISLEMRTAVSMSELFEQISAWESARTAAEPSAPLTNPPQAPQSARSHRLTFPGTSRFCPSDG